MKVWMDKEINVEIGGIRDDLDVEMDDSYTFYKLMYQY